MDEVVFKSAWRGDDPEAMSDAKNFWREHKLVSEDRIDKRAQEICSLTYVGEKLVGITTVALAEYPILRCRFAFYRCAVAPDFRKQYLATFLTRHTLTTMEAWSLEHPEEKLQGIAAIFEAWELGSKAVYPQWADWNIHLNLAGYTSGGAQIRVAWFRHATLMP